MSEDAPKVFSLVERRPTTPDPWTAESCVAEFLEEIRAGNITPAMLAIHYFVREEDGNLRPHVWTQNMSRPEQIALAFVAIDRVLTEWRS